MTPLDERNAEALDAIAASAKKAIAVLDRAEPRTDDSYAMEWAIFQLRGNILDIQSAVDFLGGKA